MSKGPIVLQRTAVPAVLAAAALLLTAGCSGGGPGGAGHGTPDRSAPASGSPKPGATAPTPPAKGSAKVVRTVADGLESPWGLVRLPGGDFLVSSRNDGTILRIDADSGKKTTIGTVPGVAAAGEGGLLGIALSPSFKNDHMVYAYFTTASDNRIVRMPYDEKRDSGQQLGAPDVLLRGIPHGMIHNGGRIAFGPDRMLYAGTGEGGQRDLAQDKDSLGGKILRMTPEGEPAPGNPFGTSGTKGYVYSYGHRNVQGLAWDTKQRLWASEFGQDTWDELNLVTPGSNGGWPVVEGKGEQHGKRYRNPLAQWRTAEASPSGIACVHGSVWMAGLRGERLWRIPLDGTHLAHDPQAFLTGKYGRLRTVLAAGDDRIWLVTSNTDGRGTPKADDDRILEVQVR